MLLFSAGVDWAVDYLMNIVKGEEKHGIQADRVMIGGFSQVFMRYSHDRRLFSGIYADRVMIGGFSQVFMQI